MKKSCENNKSIRSIRKGVKSLKNRYPDAKIDLNFKEGKRTGSHCYKLVIKTNNLGKQSLNVIHTKKSFNSNMGVLKKAKKILDLDEIYEIKRLMNNVV